MEEEGELDENEGSENRIRATTTWKLNEGVKKTAKKEKKDKLKSGKSGRVKLARREKWMRMEQVRIVSVESPYENRMKKWRWWWWKRKKDKARSGKRGKVEEKGEVDENGTSENPVRRTTSWELNEAAKKMVKQKNRKTMKGVERVEELSRRGRSGRGRRERKSCSWNPHMRTEWRSEADGEARERKRSEKRLG